MHFIIVDLCNKYPASHILNKKEKLFKEFVDFLISNTAGYISAKEIDKAISIFENQIKINNYYESSYANLLRIFNSIYDKSSFIKESIVYQHYSKIICSIAANSNYLTDIIVRNPENLYLILNPSRLENNLTKEVLSNDIRRHNSLFHNFNTKLNYIRSIKRKEILRIGVKDILGISSFEKTTEQLSVLANTITDELFNLCFSEILKKNNIDSINNKYALISLGKLGGNELNYSSDIDLILIFDSNDLYGKKEFFELLVETIHLFIESSSSITPTGYLYRVDFRLRPDGRNSPLCRSIKDYMNYYETRGEDWERQMLIKAGFVSGDEKLFQYFINYVNHFVYPSSFYNSPLEQIKKMKSKIEKNNEDKLNIKLSSGGIRDIEFSVQALQLLNGGKNKLLKTGNTLNAIELLKKENLLYKNEAQIFKTAYILYRKIEHYLQLMNDLQTHSIPEKGELLNKLSFFLGYKNSSEFLKEIAKTKKQVVEIYNSILGIEFNKKSTPLSEINFKDKTAAHKNYLFLSEGKSITDEKIFDNRSSVSFTEIEENFLIELLNSKSPDLILKNIVRIIKSAHFPSIWYEEMKDNNFLKSLFIIAEYSQKTIDIFSEDSFLRDELLTRKVFQKIQEKDLINYSIKKLHFYLAFQFTLRIISAEEVSFCLSKFISIKINNISNDFFKKKKIKENILIAGLGSFGSSSMTFSSDVDLIFIIDSFPDKIDIQKVFQDLLLKIKNEINLHSVDCRLRPEGKNSPLVWDIKNYLSYLKKRGRTWEFQSLTKLKFIYGDENLYKKITKSIQKEISNRIKNLNIIRNDFVEMRKKLYPASTVFSQFNIKKNKGGVTDIEFIIQLLVFTDKVLFGESIYSTLEKFVGQNKISKSLLINFKFLKNSELELQNIFNVSNPVLPNDKEKIFILAYRLGYSNSENFQKELNKITNENSKLFETIIKGEN